jgi:hypothetical protein
MGVKTSKLKLSLSIPTSMRSRALASTLSGYNAMISSSGRKGIGRTAISTG